MKGVKLSREEKASTTLFLLCWIMYAIVCMTKSAFSASIASIVGEGLLTKSLAGTINSGYYIFYGGAQLLLAGLVDKISPVKLINMALAGGLVAMLGFAFASNFVVMLVLWSVAGLLQFAIWPAVIKIISQYLVPSHRAKAMVYMAFAYCSGMLANYASAAIILKLSHWRMMFRVFFVILAVTAVFWVVLTKKTLPVLESQMTVEANKTQQAKKKGGKGAFGVFFASGLVFMLVPSCIRTMMDMGLKNWVPTMITENYEVSASFASMLTTILLLINLSGIYIVNFVYPKYIKSEAAAFGLCFVTALPFTLLLLLTGKIPVGVVVVLLTLVTTFMYAGHQLINVIIPSKFAKMNLSAGAASILNAVASLGAAGASFGYGYIAEHFGWTATIGVWNVMAVVAALFAFISVKRWNKFMKKNEENE